MHLKNKSFPLKVLSQLNSNGGRLTIVLKKKIRCLSFAEAGKTTINYGK